MQLEPTEFLIDARDLYRRGLLRKEGGVEAMDHYFHQVAPDGRARPVDQVLPHYARERRPTESADAQRGEAERRPELERDRSASAKARQERSDS